MTMGRPKKVVEHADQAEYTTEDLDVSALPRDVLPQLLADAKEAGDEALIAKILARCAE